jgi:glutamyl/glutaminyl-tRNA synthetase
MPNEKVITRFAPSPTGYLHVGGARTALFSWLLARHAGGQFFLRIEDTDQARSTEQACAQLLEDLNWLGLNWDNAELLYQSKRTQVYNAIIDGLVARGLAYKAWETRAELDAQRNLAQKEKRVFVYRRPQLSDEQVRRFESEGRPHVVRFAMPLKEYRYRDVVLAKDIVVAANQVQDFVIRKADGMPTYHFAVVVDDAQVNITHVLRGQEHLLNTVNHIALQEALNYPRPIYGHLPLILNTDGSKMGKRDRDKKIRHHANLWMKNAKRTVEDLSAASAIATDRLVDWIKDDQKQLDIPEQAAVMRIIGLKDADLPEILVHDFRKSGYLPEVMLNFLALLGWNPGGDREQMSVDELIQLFSIEGIGKGNAKFNREKLLAFNTDACAKASPDRLVKAFRDYLSVNPDSPLNRASDEQLRTILTMKTGFRTLRQVDESSRFLLLRDDQIEYDADAVVKVLKKNDAQGLAILRDMRELLEKVSDWTAQSLESAVNEYCQQKSLGRNYLATDLSEPGVSPQGRHDGADRAVLAMDMNHDVPA